MLRSLIGGLLDKGLPAKTKRSIFVASLVALMSGETTYDQETFSKLNRLMALSESGEKALAVPVMMSKVIWNGKTSFEVFQEDVTQGSVSADRMPSVVSRLIDSMPQWLLYGSAGDIEKDVTKLLNEHVAIGV